MEKKKLKVAINGCGRIGRAFLKLSMENEIIEVVAVNDLGSLKNIAYLLKYDSAYGVSNLNISTDEENLIINDRKIKYLSERDPSNLPWGALGIDVVVESTGAFNDYEKSQAHIKAGAKRVLITAPVKDSHKSDAPNYGVEGATVLMGINEEELKTCKISSNASCTTNAGSPVLNILSKAVGIEKAMLNTVHGYTATQKIVDVTDEKDFRKGRAGAQNIIPSTTGAAIATTKVIKELEGSFDGIAVRVPVISGSLLDITFIAKRNTSAEEINDILEKASQDPNWAGVFSVTKEPIVSSDIIGSRFASIADLNFTRVVGGNLVKVLAWYDNEMGYTNTLIRHAIKAGESL
ncbi:type I glyceraldehyde-3-phosphate dehydrogenase [Candidatus Campbellbacteria bacterium RIFOXYC2_FULL_35_25]|uniref:Type I glyceraldehyde-3-phosphate dehydrogenase n=1 Tax=Candidatus Campbellbacteria bacterium RIFOXYC2_FULL_35_25 TaxID=1797582 RepID=A0A1F5EI20_9BACT|nr:MAG: type I glyceraldehyde-3-phosphate dehydrogenase [Candidatus Campbellbacteria bacterium RIFOXYC2_FULL_35_25]